MPSITTSLSFRAITQWRAHSSRRKRDMTLRKFF
jgi:hypothetical protein